MTPAVSMSAARDRRRSRRGLDRELERGPDAPPSPGIPFRLRRGARSRFARRAGSRACEARRSAVARERSIAPARPPRLAAGDPSRRGRQPRAAGPQVPRDAAQPSPRPVRSRVARHAAPGDVRRRVGVGRPLPRDADRRRDATEQDRGGDRCHARGAARRRSPRRRPRSIASRRSSRTPRRSDRSSTATVDGAGCSSTSISRFTAHRRSPGRTIPPRDRSCAMRSTQPRAAIGAR